MTNSNYRGTILSSQHFAHKWKVAGEGELNDRDTVNRWAVEYASMAEGSEKEAKCLAIIQCFHGYLLKYVNMIVRGTLPPINTPAGSDAAKMLMTLIPEGRTPSRDNLSMACKTLHLAFKQQTTDDIYDILVTCMIRAVRKYDPFYTDKVKVICESISATTKGRKRSFVFSSQRIGESAGLDCNSYLRMLVRRGFLASVKGPKKKVIGYVRTAGWPPPQKFFESGPVGFVYFLPMYFRFYLHEYITGSMEAIESKAGMLQLDHRGDDGDDTISRGSATPHADGDLTDANGNTWAADLGLMNAQLDISVMNPAWVRKTNDRLFRNLTTKERNLLYMMYVKEYSWAAMAAELDLEPSAARKMYDQVLTYLKGRARIPSPSKITG